MSRRGFQEVLPRTGKQCGVENTALRAPDIRPKRGREPRSRKTRKRLVEEFPIGAEMEAFPIKRRDGVCNRIRADIVGRALPEAAAAADVRDQ
jgi:hypothetical protein